MIDQKTFGELRQMVGEGFIHELLEAFFENCPQLIVDMQAALAAGDAATFQRLAHSMKSNSASFGALELAAQARILETLGREGSLDGAASLLTGLEDMYNQAEIELKELAG